MIRHKDLDRPSLRKETHLQSQRHLKSIRIKLKLRKRWQLSLIPSNLIDHSNHSLKNLALKRPEDNALILHRERDEASALPDEPLTDVVDAGDRDNETVPPAAQLRSGIRTIRVMIGIRVRVLVRTCRCLRRPS